MTCRVHIPLLRTTVQMVLARCVAGARIRAETAQGLVSATDRAFTEVLFAFP